MSGNYNFAMSSDDQGGFWLSKDADPANITPVAFEPVLNGRRDWTGLTRRDASAPENRSTTLFPTGIPLVAGEFYYFEALMKEGGGGDNLAVTWQIPGAPAIRSASVPIPAVYAAALADPEGANITITDQPDSQLFISVPPTVVQGHSTIVLEAEHFSSKTDAGGKSWTFGTAASGFAGTGYMEELPNTGGGDDKCQLHYEFNFPQAGTWYVWLRSQRRLLDFHDLVLNSIGLGL